MTMRSSSQESQSEDLKRRIENHLDMYRYKNVEPRYLNTSTDKQTKDLNEYFVNLQRVAAKKPSEINSLKLKF